MKTKEQILREIAEIESAGGKNVNHPLMKTGMHKGMSAIGKYALMPKTIDDLVKNDPELQYLSRMDQLAKRKALMSNPELENILASKYYEKAARGSQTPQEIAYKWYHGYNSKPTQEQLQKSDYVNKFNRLSGYLQNNNNQIAKNIPNINNVGLENEAQLPTIDIEDELNQILSDPNNPFLAENDEDDDDIF